MRKRLAFALMIGAATSPISAQDIQFPAVSVGPIAGVYIPMNKNSEELSTTVTLGVQVRGELTKYFGLTATIWWAGSEAELPSLFDGVEPIDLYHYDLGVEFRPPPLFQEHKNVTPFLGIGAGGVTYDFRDICGSAESDFSAFASMGLEVLVEHLAFRLEGRGYLWEFDGFFGEKPESEKRNGLTVSAGFVYRF